MSDYTEKKLFYFKPFKNFAIEEPGKGQTILDLKTCRIIDIEQMQLLNHLLLLDSHLKKMSALDVKIESWDFLQLLRGSRLIGRYHLDSQSHDGETNFSRIKTGTQRRHCRFSSIPKRAFLF